MTSLTLLYFYALLFLVPQYNTIIIPGLLLAALIIVMLIISQYLNKRSSTRCVNYLVLLSLLTGFMLVMRIFHSTFNIGYYSLSTVIQDIISMIILASGAVLTAKKDFNDSDLMRYLKFIGTIAVLSGILALLHADFSMARKANIWQPQYIWWGLLFPWSYLLLYNIIMKKNTIFWNILAYGSSVMYVVLGLLFEKRVVIFELVMILIIIVLAIRKKSFLELLRTSVIAISLLLIGILMAQYIFDFKLFELIRFTFLRFTIDSLIYFDRFIEFMNLFYTYPLSILITGAGLGSYQSILGVNNINLHIGWLNFIFKGGILFLALELWIFSVAIKTFHKSKDKLEKYISACVIFSYMVILISSSWVPSPILLNFSFMKFALLRITESSKSRKMIARHALGIHGLELETLSD